MWLRDHIDDLKALKDKKDIMNKIAHDVIPYSQGKYLDMFSSTDTFGQNVISNRKPFYEK